MSTSKEPKIENFCKLTRVKRCTESCRIACEFSSECVGRDDVSCHKREFDDTTPDNTQNKTESSESRTHGVLLRFRSQSTAFNISLNPPMEISVSTTASSKG